jgi:peptidoglycan/LPS O-acetylase OafA/YrhL
VDAVTAGPLTASAPVPVRPADRDHAPAAVAPPPGHPRFPLIDSVRALAALGILLTHTATFSGFSSHTWWGALWHNLDLGVPVFFVISGFLLYRPFVAAQTLGAPQPSTRAYAWRRMLRIVPAYWLALTVLAWLANLPDVFTGDWWRYYFFLQIYSFHTLYGGLNVAWTLCIEVTFYALLPLYAMALARLSSGRQPGLRFRLELIILPLLALTSLTLRAIDLAGPRTVAIATIAENFDWFALGMLLAVLSVTLQGGRPLPRPLEFLRGRPGSCWLLAFAIYVILAAVVHYPVVGGGAILRELALAGMVRHIGFGVIAVLIVLPAIFPRPSGVPGRVLAWRVLAWLGLISYGIYLWHSPLVGKLIDHGALNWIPHLTFVVLTAATAAIAFACAACSYYVLERPILKLKDIRPLRS